MSSNVIRTITCDVCGKKEETGELEPGPKQGWYKFCLAFEDSNDYYKIKPTGDFFADVCRSCLGRDLTASMKYQKARITFLWFFKKIFGGKS